MGTAVAPYAERAIAGVEPSDAALVAAVRCGEDRAFEQLFERYQRRISAYVYGMVSDHGRAEDLTQDIFISALRRMRETERPIAFKPWIYEIAKNACIDQFRRSRRTEEVSYDAEEGLGAADYGRLTQRGPSPDAAVDQKQALHDLCGAFGGLSETHHQILVLRELEGLSYREIGDRLGMSRPSVESTLFRARRRLSEEYDELASGQRCLRVQALIANATEGLLGARDGRRLARHLSHCQPCRKQARTAGVDGGVMARRPTRREVIGARIAGVLPFPAFLQRRRGDAESVLGAGTSHGHAVVAHWSAMGTMTEPFVAGWSKAAAAAATIVLAGVGAGVGSQVVPPAARDGDGDRSSARSASGSSRSGAVRVVRSRATVDRPSRRAAAGLPAAPAAKPERPAAKRPSPAAAPTGSAPASTRTPPAGPAPPVAQPPVPPAADAPAPPADPAVLPKGDAPRAPTAPEGAPPAPNGQPSVPAGGVGPPSGTVDPTGTVQKGAADAGGQVEKATSELPGG